MEPKLTRWERIALDKTSMMGATCQECGDKYNKRNRGSLRCSGCVRRAKKTPAEKWLEKKPYVNNAPSFRIR